MKQQIGQITLQAKQVFTQYTESANRTDYVTCEPQASPLYWDGYWLFAEFAGILTDSTYRQTQIAEKAGCQWSFPDQIPDYFSVSLSKGRFVDTGAVFSADCGAASGKPIRRYETAPTGA